MIQKLSIGQRKWEIMFEIILIQNYWLKQTLTLSLWVRVQAANIEEMAAAVQKHLRNTLLLKL